MFVTISFIVTMLVTESTLAGYFENLRDAPLFGVALMLLLALPGISPAKTGRMVTDGYARHS
jgi:hypothetical protein